MKHSNSFIGKPLYLLVALEVVAMFCMVPASLEQTLSQ